MLYWLRLSRGDLYASLGDKLLMKTFLRLLTWEINDSVTSMYSYAYFVQHEFFYYFDAVLICFKIISRILWFSG